MRGEGKYLHLSHYCPIRQIRCHHFLFWTLTPNMATKMDKDSVLNNFIRQTGTIKIKNTNRKILTKENHIHVNVNKEEMPYAILASSEGFMRNKVYFLQRLLMSFSTKEALGWVIPQLSSSQSIKSLSLLPSFFLSLLPSFLPLLPLSSLPLLPYITGTRSTCYGRKPCVASEFVYK